MNKDYYDDGIGRAVEGDEFHLLFEHVGDALHLHKLHLRLVITLLHQRLVERVRRVVKHRLLAGHEQHWTPGDQSRN